MAAAADSSGLIRTRVLFVTGKGGTGKTSVSAALGRLAASQGRRTVVLEVDAQRPALTAIFGLTPSYEPVEVEPGLFAGNIEWGEALEGWIEHIVQMRRVVRLITKNRVVALFLNVTPGARDLVVLWRIQQLAARFDTVVVDMPASGNAVAMLTVPYTAERLFAAGPIRRCADEILAMYRRSDTASLLVALPEEMVVNETVETLRRLDAEAPAIRVAALVLNRASPPTLLDAERRLLAALAEGPHSVESAELVGAGEWEAALEAATGEALGRLREEGGPPVLSLPLLPRSAGPARLVAQLAAAFARQSAVPLELRGVG
jgi:anion-transporting  ArsA/GET3 family ATPase